jgi:tRNA pseudouridine55 synthase
MPQDAVLGELDHKGMLWQSTKATRFSLNLGGVSIVETVNGLLVIDKPSAMTSHDVVSRVRRVTGESTTGHLGTLDPMATGVLPVLIGKYTRLAQFFGPLTKTYTGAIRFGFATDTYDADGIPAAPAELGAPLPANDDIQAAAALFRGQVDQTPPPFSAKKVDGKPAYKAARRGESVVLKPVTLMIEDFVIGPLEGEYAEFTIRISSGGYVRSVAHELGQVLGCGAHLARLRRVAAGPFTLAQAMTLDELSDQAAAGTLEQRLPHPRTLLPELPATTADLWVAGRLRNGNAVNLPEYSTAPLAKVFAGQRDLVAIVRRVAGTLFQPIVVLG